MVNDTFQLERNKSFNASLLHFYWLPSSSRVCVTVFFYRGLWFYRIFAKLRLHAFIVITRPTRHKCATESNLFGESNLPIDSTWSIVRPPIRPIVDQNQRCSDTSIYKPCKRRYRRRYGWVGAFITTFRSTGFQTIVTSNGVDRPTVSSQHDATSWIAPYRMSPTSTDQRDSHVNSLLKYGAMYTPLIGRHCEGARRKKAHRRASIPKTGKKARWRETRSSLVHRPVKWLELNKEDCILILGIIATFANKKCALYYLLTCNHSLNYLAALHAHLFFITR